MGTSSSNSGTNGNTPIIPSWVDTPSDKKETVPPSKKREESSPSPKRPTIPEKGDKNRFQGARKLFSQYASSNGSDKRSLKGSISKYVTHSLGGSKNASKRMGISKTASVNLLNFLSTASSQGFEKALDSIGLPNLAGKPIDDIFIGLIDHICPSDGAVDIGITRDAYIKTVADLASADVGSLNSLSEEQVKTVFEIFATYTIEARICNDIGTKSISLPTNVDSIVKVQNQLRDFIKGAVADAINREFKKGKGLTQKKTRSFVDKVYRQAFSILEVLGNEE
ncbi:Qat anti-phage system associated protein QatB [Leptospira sp. WS58.C1]|uniref:Qat anti-phage system associated protein QatB n=1 Tax=Leptospira cinconiae TaxID=3235173 RepID=UPI00349EE6D9